MEKKKKIIKFIICLLIIFILGFITGYKYRYYEIVSKCVVFYNSRGEIIQFIDRK